MKTIPLSQGKLAIVDDEDFEKLNQFKWYARKSSSGYFYAVRKVRREGKWKTESMHRQILGTQPGQETDHINHDGLDNRRENIRICTISQNHMNQIKQKKETSSRFKGVSLEKRCLKKWYARIQYKGERKSIGYFFTEEEAAKAYDDAAKRYFDKYANLNFPI